MLRKQPKYLNSLPKNYKLDTGDKREISSYKANWKRKMRAKNKVNPLDL